MFSICWINIVINHLVNDSFIYMYIALKVSLASVQYLGGFVRFLQIHKLLHYAILVAVGT